ncbi:hypothetical protein J6590_048206 [Homalodisca vitripennis]|nr:hypothetical protein J6590_048206 [Homalodisca vitripennis]
MKAGRTLLVHRVAVHIPSYGGPRTKYLGRGVGRQQGLAGQGDPLTPVSSESESESRRLNCCIVKILTNIHGTASAAPHSAITPVGHVSKCSPNPQKHLSLYFSEDTTNKIAPIKDTCCDVQGKSARNAMSSIYSWPHFPVRSTVTYGDSFVGFLMRHIISLSAGCNEVSALVSGDDRLSHLRVAIHIVPSGTDDMRLQGGRVASGVWWLSYASLRAVAPGSPLVIVQPQSLDSSCPLLRTIEMCVGEITRGSRSEGCGSSLAGGRPLLFAPYPSCVSEPVHNRGHLLLICLFPIFINNKSYYAPQKTCFCTTDIWVDNEKVDTSLCLENLRLL